MKTCTKCSECLENDKFSKRVGKGDGLQSWCKRCVSTYEKSYYQDHIDLYHANRTTSSARSVAWRHRTGRARPMTEAIDSTVFLGVVIAERALSKFFDHIEHMPYGNKGFDFRCGKNFKIDVKSACLYHPARGSSSWAFHIKKNHIADYFLMLAFDDRSSLEPQHVWLVPGCVVNDRKTVHVTNNLPSLTRWRMYEKPIDRVVCCCDKIRQHVGVDKNDI
jgi:hypothetical protein